jgi:hypothetical protein
MVSPQSSVEGWNPGLPRGGRFVKLSKVSPEFIIHQTVRIIARWCPRNRPWRGGTQDSRVAGVSSN